MENRTGHLFYLTSRKYITTWVLLVLIVSTVSIFFIQYLYFHVEYGPKDIKNIEKVIHKSEALIDREFDILLSDSSGFLPKVMDDRFSYHEQLADEYGIFLFYFERGYLKYWSDNTVPLGPRWSSRLKVPVLELANGTYVTNIRELEDGVLLGLIRVRTNYPFENEYLENSYEKAINLKKDIKLERLEDINTSPVFNRNGEYLFSFEIQGEKKENRILIFISQILFLIVILSLFVYVSIKIDRVTDRTKRTAWLGINISVLALLSFLIFYFETPAIIFQSELFSPGIFASLTFSSLGQLLIILVLSLFVVLQFYWFFNRSGMIRGNIIRVFGIVTMALASLYFVFFHHLVKILVLDSTISFEAHKLNTLSVYTIIGLIIISSAFLIFILLLDKSFSFISGKNRTQLLLRHTGIGAIIQVPFIYFGSWQTEILTFGFFILSALAVIYFRSGSSERIHFPRFYFIVFVSAVFITIELQNHTEEKVGRQKEIELAKLSSEHDAVAEMLFEDLSERILSDSLLLNRMKYQIIDIDLIREYLLRNYFSGYWTKYNLRPAVCRPEDDLLDVGEHCYTFYDDLVDGEGIQIENSNFYFLNNLNGRISYLAVIPYHYDDEEITLFLELDSKLISEELGYPSLLLEEKPSDTYSFSYAKYNAGKLIASGGSYDYRLNSEVYTSSENTFEEVRSDGYNHTIFNIDPLNTVIVSTPVVTIVDRLIALSYFFAFLYSLFALGYLFVSASHLRSTVTWDFKNKIQYSTIGILFLTFVVICAGTIYFVLQQYRIKHQDNMDNTMRSLYIELVHKVEDEEDIRNWTSESYYNLNELLRKFSNVFYTDINLYDRSGRLLATSRSEIFDNGLSGRLMNRQAFENLAFEGYSAFNHTEKIGGMSYQSAYIPLLNGDNQFLAYLNLPYFTQPEVLAQEVSNLVVAILNTYVILLLLILFLSVFLADRITQPLRFIQSRIAQLSLNNTNEKIIYNGKDELASLVDEYNYMVEELTRSAQLLAQSERESAWREMAKQIAHEIKNPLTPMKLNVQHLQRMIEAGADNIEEKVRKVSETLIEQIDSLTSIANEFSDFAKMPRAKNKQINIARKLRTVANLYENSKGVNIGMNLEGFEKVQTYGDPEQFQRVIINLVKNGIQSVPEGRDIKIEIGMEEAPEDTVIISVSDNGKGIPRDIQDKLFRPNFTTKSSGMGMGLAIASNIIKVMNGNIWYSTREGEGTTFYIKVPVTGPNQA